MLRKVVTLTILGILAQALVAGSAFAQGFSSLVTQATSTNRTWISQVDQALEATDRATLQAGAATALATGQQVQSLLQAALPLAPDDASRSRVQGVLAHVTAALQSGQQVAQARDFDTARSELNAERGEAQEALGELAPLVTVPSTATPVATSTPTALPTTGGAPASAAILCGLALTLGGVALRQTDQRSGPTTSGGTRQT